MKINLECKCGAKATFEDATNQWLMTLSSNMGKWVSSHDKCLENLETSKEKVGK